MLYYERKLKKRKVTAIIGVDEAGRGPLAGPVVAAAVFLKTFRFTARIDDSKKLSPSQREEASLEIIAKSVFGIGIVSEVLIDEVNIRNATRLAMERAVAGLAVTPTYLLIDALHLPGLSLPQLSLIKGDARALSIAAASVLAKTTRDAFMCEMASVYPDYGFARHKGYGTSAHSTALERLGPCAIHRLSFAPVRQAEAPC